MCYLMYEQCRHLHGRQQCVDLNTCSAVIPFEVFFCLRCWGKKYFSIKYKSRAAKELQKNSVKNEIHKNIFLDEGRYTLDYINQRIHLEKKAAKRYIAKAIQEEDELVEIIGQREEFEQRKTAVWRQWATKYVRRMSEKDTLKDKDGKKIWLILPTGPEPAPGAGN